jgi:hypothetical protein
MRLLTLSSKFLPTLYLLIKALLIEKFNSRNIGVSYFGFTLKATYLDIFDSTSFF